MDTNTSSNEKTDISSTPNGGSAERSGSDCVRDSCVYFDGNQDWLNNSNYSHTYLNDDFSIAFWVNSNNSDSNSRFITYYINATTYIQIIVVSTSGNSLGYVGKFNSGSESGLVSANGAVTDGVWEHNILRCKPSTGLCEFWNNGVNITSSSLSGYGVGTNVGVTLGIRNDFSSSDFIGSLDDVQFYNTYLTEEQIERNYNDGLGGGFATINHSASYQSFSPGWDSNNYTIDTDTNFIQAKFKVFGNKNETAVINDINFTAYNYTGVAGCSPNWINTSWSDWYNVSICWNNDTISMEMNLTQWDNTSCDLTNTTFYNYSYSTCDNCTPSLTNTSISGWANVTGCYANDTIQAEMNITQWDTLMCVPDNIANDTWSNYSFFNCQNCTANLTNTSWGAWSNYTNCYANSTLFLVQNLTQWDLNNCVGNTTFYNYSWDNCTLGNVSSPLMAHAFYHRDTSTGALSLLMYLSRLGDLIIEGLTGSYGSGEAYLCVYDNGTIFAKDSACS